MKIGFLGAGNMAEAIACSLQKQDDVQLLAYDTSAVRCDVFRNLGASVVGSAEILAESCDLLMICVKPQMMNQALAGLAPCLSEGQLVASIAAGISVAQLSEALPNASIVRVMPNTPLMVGRGAAGIYADKKVDVALVNKVRDVFALSSEVIVVDDETLIDAVTAVSGSGPAYFFYLIEAMIEAGVREGLTPEQARRLAAATCAGAGQMAAESDESPAVMRAKVTSPNGTTQAAIEFMDEASIQSGLVAGIRRAAERSRELRSV